MADTSHCGYGDCCFAGSATDLALHDAETGHPCPGGSPLAVAVARVRDLCARFGGHEWVGAACACCGAPREVARG